MTLGICYAVSFLNTEAINAFDQVSEAGTGGVGQRVEIDKESRWYNQIGHDAMIQKILLDVFIPNMSMYLAFDFCWHQDESRPS